MSASRRWWPWGGLLGAALLVALMAVRPFAGSPLPDRWREARAGWLYRSAQIAPGDVEEFLRNERIGTILDLSSDEVDPLREAEAVASRDLGIRYYHLPVEKGTKIENLAKAVAEIERAHLRGDRVWLHCAVGHRRSAAAFVALRAVDRARAAAHRLRRAHQVGRARLDLGARDAALDRETLRRARRGG